MGLFSRKDSNDMSAREAQAWKKALEKVAFEQASERDRANADGHGGRVDFLLDEKNAREGNGK